MSLYPENIADKMNNPKNDWLSGADFDGDGIVLQTVRVDIMPSQYGVDEDHYYVQQEVLRVGETFCYIFKDSEGNERKFSSHSRPFAISMQQAEVEPNDWVRITRTGTGKNTRYQVEKVEQPISHAKTESKGIDYPEDLNPENIPF